MNITEFRLKIVYPIYCAVKKIMGSPLHLPIQFHGNAANEQIRELLRSPKPCMIARFGSLELATIYFELFFHRFSCWEKIRSLWNLEIVESRSSVLKKLNTNAGFFPVTDETVSRFFMLMTKDMADLDCLACWRPEEVRLKQFLPPGLKTIGLYDLEPFMFEAPWTAALEGKKVLVVHPFKTSILQQYQKRRDLFQNKDMLPDFDLQVIQAVQSMGGSAPGFHDWFEALDYMKQQISKARFDIALIGAGAYGFPLAAHVKRMGKKAVHLGGVLQMLFGIYGSRWKNEPFINEHWIRPSAAETPAASKSVENSCYW